MQPGSRFWATFCLPNARSLLYSTSLAGVVSQLPQRRSYMLMPSCFELDTSRAITGTDIKAAHGYALYAFALTHSFITYYAEP